MYQTVGSFFTRNDDIALMSYINLRMVAELQSIMRISICNLGSNLLRIDTKSI